MNTSKLGSTDRVASAAAAIVVVTALLSLSNDWGLLMALSLLAGIGGLAVTLLPSLSPATNLPAPKGISLLALGAVAAVSTTLVAFNWLGWIVGHFVKFDTLQFVTGLVAAFVMLGAGFAASRSEARTTSPSRA
jgi:hypothetical protein